MFANATLCLLVCRGCCCGTTRKHPEVNHLTQIHHLRRSARSSGVQMVITDCLGSCDRSNVVVLRRRDGDASQTIWLGGLLRDDQTGALAQWLATGGSAFDALPPALAACRFAPDDEARRCLAQAEAAPTPPAVSPEPRGFF